MDAMDKMKNQVFRLFDKGEFERAIVGDEHFFFRDDLWGDHNSTGIFLWLFDWLKEQKEARVVIDQIKKILAERLDGSKEISEIDGSLISIVLIRSYCMAAKARQFWPIEKDFIMKLLYDYIEKFTVEETKKFNIERDMKELKEKYLG